MPEKRTFTAYIERDHDTGLLVAFVPGLPGAHTQAESLDELKANLTEVIALCLEDMPPENLDSLPEFVGLQSIEVAM